MRHLQFVTTTSIAEEQEREGRKIAFPIPIPPKPYFLASVAFLRLSQDYKNCNNVGLRVEIT